MPTTGNERFSSVTYPSNTKDFHYHLYYYLILDRSYRVEEYPDEDVGQIDEGHHEKVKEDQQVYFLRAQIHDCVKE